VAFAAAIERYLFRPATWLETFLLLCGAFGLLWPAGWYDLAGFIALGAAIALQTMHKPQNA
jgi:TRAP-type uncharacterized transport system fused permease subunit